MDVFDLIGGERSDISDWEDDDDDEDGHDNDDFASGDVPAVAMVTAATVALDAASASAMTNGGEDDDNDNDDDDDDEGDEEEEDGEAATLPTALVQTATHEGDALNLFTINPVSKQDAKDYPPLLGMHLCCSGDADSDNGTDGTDDDDPLQIRGGVDATESIAGTSAPSAVAPATTERGSSTPTQASSSIAPGPSPSPSPRRADLPFLAENPHLDVMVLDNVLTEDECARIVATVRVLFSPPPHCFE